MRSYKNLFLARYGYPQDIDNNLNSKNKDIRIAVIEHPNINKEHINKALQEGQ